MMKDCLRKINDRVPHRFMKYLALHHISQIIVQDAQGSQHFPEQQWPLLITTTLIEGWS